MLATPQLSLKPALFSLFLGVLVLPGSAGANPNCSQKDCICPAEYLCVLPLHINNSRYVHFKVFGGSGVYFNVRQGNRQFETRSGETIYVNRSKDGPTSFGVQVCSKTLTGSDCDDWYNFNLQEPTVGQLRDCEDYAEQAVAAAKDNVKFNCGYGGGRWADDYKAHYNACAFAPESDAIKAERVARVNDLKTCQDKAAAAPATPVLEAPPPPVAGSTWKRFVGVWDTTVQPDKKIELTMSQQGSFVQGSYTGDGRISGRAVGNQLTFNWVQPGASGTGKFFISDDETSFSGSFSTTQDPNRFFAWGGRKVK